MNFRMPQKTIKQRRVPVSSRLPPRDRLPARLCGGSAPTVPRDGTEDAQGTGRTTPQGGEHELQSESVDRGRRAPRRGGTGSGGVRGARRQRRRPRAVRAKPAAVPAAEPELPAGPSAEARWLVRERRVPPAGGQRGPCPGPAGASRAPVRRAAPSPRQPQTRQEERQTIMGARGTVGLAPLALLLALAAAVLHARTAAAQEIRDQVLPGCGICYPGGYDVNTVGVVTGSVVELQEPAEGPVRFVVAGESERWVVLASPAWFWKSAKRRLQSGDAVTVLGSKTLGADGTLYLVAREIRHAGDAPVIVLRDRREPRSGAAITAPAGWPAAQAACVAVRGREAAETTAPALVSVGRARRTRRGRILTRPASRRHRGEPRAFPRRRP